MNTTNHKQHMTRLRRNGLALILSLLASQFAAASAPETNYKMIALVDQAQGKLIVAGEYRKAIDKLAASESRSTSFSAYNNLCVAYMKEKKLEQAEMACNKAVALRSSVNKILNPYLDTHTRNKARDKAIALSNRGVLHVIKGDKQLALQDFEESMQSYDRLSDVRENLALLTVEAVASTATVLKTR
ncbi:hypothetical protein [Woeseia oceani]|uniref:Tetratricopeptide repeat protein n=1 Tax=Woeseia oceani TaxID=1548547 RepID=A0A193LJA9_9GAMM|nr:hypothetical protein [Woeseia oceani]ANO52620.1 hypothetical protein BA177_16795 [Woeseia oceani]